jgi:hypothetical protein
MITEGLDNELLVTEELAKGNGRQSLLHQIQSVSDSGSRFRTKKASLSVWGWPISFQLAALVLVPVNFCTSSYLVPERQARLQLLGGFTMPLPGRINIHLAADRSLPTCLLR